MRRPSHLCSARRRTILRLALSTGFPAIVLATTDESRATQVSLAIQKQGHRVLECDLRDIVPSSRMTALRDFRFEPGELVSSAEGSERLPLSDVVGLFRATHRVSHVSTHEVKERKLRPGMALATGGLIMTKTTTRGHFEGRGAGTGALPVPGRAKERRGSSAKKGLVTWVSVPTSVEPQARTSGKRCRSFARSRRRAPTTNDSSRPDPGPRRGGGRRGD